VGDEGHTPGPYFTVNPHLPLITELDPETHARVTERLGTRIQSVAAGPSNLPDGWENVDCPSWTDIWEDLSDRVKLFILTGDPDERPPGQETARGFDTRSGGVMGVAVNLHSLRRPNQQWLLRSEQVMRLLVSLDHVRAYAHDHASSSERAAEWLWTYNVVPARDHVRGRGFGRDVEAGQTLGERGTGDSAAVAQEDPGDRGLLTGAAAAEGPSPDTATEDDPLQAVLAYVARLEVPYDEGIRDVCHEVARLGLDDLAQQRTVDALHERTDVPRATLRRQLASEVRVTVKERRDAAKRAPAGVLTAYVYVERAGALWKLNPPGWVTLAAFRAMWGNEQSLSALEPEGGVSRCSRSTYQPGQQWARGFDRNAARWVFDGPTQLHELNTWEPSALVPMLGATDEDVAPWLHHLDKVLGVPAGDREHLLDWLACTVALPGVKINHMLILGGGQGLGKDTVIQPILEAVGRDNALIIPGADAVADFDNEALSHCALMVLQELSTGDLAEARRAYNHLKTYAASPPKEIQINIKGVKQFPTPNLMNVCAVTNDRRALRIEQDDRRAFLVWCEGRKADIDPSYFGGLWRWYETGGHEAVVGWLLARDLSGFNPKAPPPLTAWRAQAQEDSLPDVAQVVRDLIVEGEGPAGDEIATAADLLPLVRARMAGSKNPPTERTVGYSLTELGYRSRRVNEPLISAKAAGRLSRRKATFFFLRNEKHWQAETEGAFWIAGSVSPGEKID